MVKTGVQRRLSGQSFHEGCLSGRILPRTDKSLEGLVVANDMGGSVGGWPG